MSTRVACNLPGLLGAPRSMNVRREDPEKWTLEAPACSTRSLETCAASAASAVAPARGICDSGRPAVRPLSARSANRTRKPPPRPSGASTPCAPGWSVWSVARHGGRRAHDLCKGNYAASVKEIMPLGPGIASLGLDKLSCITSVIAHSCLRWGLTMKNDWSIIIFTFTISYAQETTPRPQVAGPSATGLLESASRTGQRRTVPDPRVFRSPRPRSGQVRNAAPGRNRGPAGEPISSRLRLLPALLLPGAGRLPTGRPAGANAPEAGTQASTQAHRRSAHIYPPTSSGRSLLTFGGSGFAHPGSLWHRGSSSQHRTRFGAQSKKTAVNEALPESVAGEDWAARYEDRKSGV